MLLLQPSERSSDPGDCRLREARLVLPLTSQEHYSVTGRDFRKKEGGSAASWEAVDPDHISEPFPLAISIDRLPELRKWCYGVVSRSEQEQMFAGDRLNRRSTPLAYLFYD